MCVEGCQNLLGSSLHLLLAQLDVAMEIDIALGVDGQKMDVGMGHFEAEHHLGHLLAGEGCARMALATRLAKTSNSASSSSSMSKM